MLAQAGRFESTTDGARDSMPSPRRLRKPKRKSHSDEGFLWVVVAKKVIHIFTILNKVFCQKKGVGDSQEKDCEVGAEYCIRSK